MNQQAANFGEGDASFQAAGGLEGVNKLVRDFYGYMDSLPEARRIRDMHPDDLEESIDKLATFLCGWLGGPRLYAEKYGTGRGIPAVHQHLNIGEADRDAWLGCMARAIADQDYSREFGEYLLFQLRRPAERIVQVCQMRHT